MFDQLVAGTCIIASGSLIAMNDLVEDSEKLGSMSVKALLALGIIVLAFVVIYQHRKTEKEHLAERERAELAHKAEQDRNQQALENLMEYHQCQSTEFTQERNRWREELTDLVKNNTAAMTHLTDVIKAKR